ncbi:MAG: carboxypeptidase-like regulatory domain-containing protein [Chloroherpetonaceae bacterium]|nr:carboxypeptidase-like regulatory domain-containing protein [Chthonomonadaceae bacterium]MDW8208101.1 carboxypeptidase-like regulatory domain-containing protein [Chloroherpetonaceae bacterium]
MTGTVTDIEGSAIVGAVVDLEGQTANSTQFGAFQIPEVEIPAGQLSRIATVSATRTINGELWSGQNTVEMLAGDTFTRNVQIVLSPQATQGTVAGVVRNTNGDVLVGARVFVGQISANDPADFDNLASFYAFTNSRGEYRVPRLPPGNRYVVTASFAGHRNRTASSVVVAPGQTTTVNFSLQPSSINTDPDLGVVRNFAAISITTPAMPTRSAGDPPQSRQQRAFEAIKQWIRQRVGYDRRRPGDPGRRMTLQIRSRNTPAGTIIENDLFWDYVPIETLLGYIILRSDNIDTNFRTIALLRDPLAERFADVDDRLTPDLNYYYSVARLDTLRFPQTGYEGDPSDVVVVRPLGPISLMAPPSGSTQARPRFFWSLVNRATLYQILVYDRFPDLQSDTNPQGVRPIWPADLNNPGSSLIDVRQRPPQTQNNQLYDGPPLVSGRTYYWAVLAIDEVGSAFTISPIQSFVAQ